MDNKKIEVYKMKRDGFSEERVVVNIYDDKLAEKIGGLLRNMGRKSCNDGDYEEAEVLINAGNTMFKALHEKRDETTPETSELPLI